jgi:hypothetical protein
MRSIFAAALAATLIVTPALAAGTADAGALTAGKPAGVQKAQLEAGGVLLWVGILAAAGAIAAIASTTQGNGSTSATSTTP